MRTLFISDLDGTLLRPDGRLSPFTIDTLNGLTQRGVHFSYATARSIHSASVVTHGLHVPTPVIVYNGAFIIRPDTRELVDVSLFGESDAAEALRLMIDHGVYPLVYALMDGRECVSYHSAHVTPGVAAYLASRQKDKRLRPVADVSQLFAGDIFYFSCIDTEQQLGPLHPHFAKDRRFNCVFHKDIYPPYAHWLELMPRRASKGKAILRLKEMLQCQRVVCFGDGLNDLPMFAIADESYAVENAVPALKEAATAVIPANTEDGVAHFLAERFGL